MNRLLLLLCFSLAVAHPGSAQAIGAPAEAARIQGTVRAADTGQPLWRARVTLVMAQTRAVPRVSITDAEGRFLFREVLPGRYRLFVERNGYVRQEYGRRGRPPSADEGREGRGGSLTVSAGQDLDDLEFRLIRAGVITGRIFDEESEVVPGVQVRAMRFGYEGGSRTLMGTSGGSTDDRGEFRIFDLPPGRYFVSATYRTGRGSAGAMVFSGSGEDMDADSYVSTYYPGTTDPARAVSLELLPGQELGGIDFTLTPARAIRVRGAVTNLLTGLPARGAQVMLLPRDPVAREFLRPSQGTADEAQGGFEVRVPAPGRYLVYATQGERGRSLVGSQIVEVGDADLDGILVTIGPGMEIRGRVRVEGASELKMNTLRISLRPRDSGRFFGGTNTEVNAQGMFSLQNVLEDAYYVNVLRAPEDFFVKSVKHGTEEVLERGFSVAQGRPTSPLDILLSVNGGRIEGLVVDRDGSPATGTVVLVPHKDRRHLAQFYEFAATDPMGRFVLRGIAPGEYKLFAWDDVEPGAYYDPEFLGAFEDRGVAVRVAEASAQTIELKVIPAKPADR